MAKLDISQSLSQHFEPKRQNRFYVEIDGIPSWMVKNFQRPKPSNGSIEIDYLNNKRYLAGKTSMASITLLCTILSRRARRKQFMRGRKPSMILLLVVQGIRTITPKRSP